MGCDIEFTFFMSTNCEFFEITPSSDIATISNLLNAWPGPGPLLGKVVEIDLELGQQIEIVGGNVSSTNMRMIMCKKGSATGGSATTLVDTTANWPPGFLDNNAAVVVYAGTGAGLVSTITSNTKDTLNFGAVGLFTVDATSKYAVVVASPSGSKSFMPTGGFNPPLILTAWDTGTYTFEFAATKGSPVWGQGARSGYFGTISNVGGGGTVPLQDIYGATYDSTRDCFWICDTGGWLVQVDGSGFPVSRTQPAGFGNAGLCYDPTNDVIVFVINGVSWGAIDPNAKTVAWSAAAAGDWHFMAFCPANSFVYTSGGWVLNAASHTVVAHIAGIGAEACPCYVSSDQTMWYPEHISTVIHIIDTATQLQVAVVSGMPGNVYQTQGAFCPVNGRFYVGGTWQSSALVPPISLIHVIDAATRAWLHDFSLFIPSNPASIIYRPQDQALYVPSQTLCGELCPVLQVDVGTESEIKRFLGPSEAYRTLMGSTGNIGIASDSSLGCTDAFAVLKP